MARYVCTGERCTLSEGREFAVECGTQESGRDRGAIGEGLLEGKGWRKGNYWRRELRKLMRISAKALFGGGKRYLGLASSVSEKIEAGTLAIYGRVLSTNQCREN
ncbi:MAG: hypothetical protein HRU72_14690 [Planctomycetia bacterium]|nr:hypothetical protein [Candidatus Brocadia sp.]QOJ07697.1 MAG: hypothetical protein HRU72_14690 [Planctomycetia bacterium]TVL97271.1 MAG: hypothetical protein CV082_04605 [Candidatus Brocadia sp. BL1]HQU31806.1 hypothetical protein [Candidatus Brocadia sapporoensis]